MYKLISATPSPYARKVRILLAEKGVPFELITEVPWNADASTPDYNPLGKVPVLILPDGGTVYESRFICEWLDVHHPEPALTPADPEARLAVRRFEVLADGICDALVLMFFENARGEGRSAPWFERQARKVAGGLAEIDRLVASDRHAWGEAFGMADISVGCLLGYLTLRWPDHDWRKSYPRLARLSDHLEQRPSFIATRPSPQAIVGRVA